MYLGSVLLGSFTIISCTIASPDQNSRLETSQTENESPYDRLKKYNHQNQIYEAEHSRHNREAPTLQQAWQNLQLIQQQQSREQRRVANNYGPGPVISKRASSMHHESHINQEPVVYTSGYRGLSIAFRSGWAPTQNTGDPNVRINEQTGESVSNNQNQENVPLLRSLFVTNPSGGRLNENTIEEASCIGRCPSVGNYNPVCGTDNVTYSNKQKLLCAQQCGRNVSIGYSAICI